ncbi:MAG: DUF5906 domain-containing protein [Spirochaetia bacterium]|nr:DUF5906 domain-containing protein [Spirochaetia bacterium]
MILNKKDFIKSYGFRVFPIKNDKSPSIKDWRNAAAYNPEIEANAYGILCGQKVKGKTLIVIDIDNHTDIGKSISGVDVWKKLNFGFFDTLTIQTPRQGYHLYFLADDNQIDKLRSISVSNKLADEVEIFFQDNHYIVGAFSEVKMGNYIIVNSKPIQRLPEALIEQYRDCHTGGTVEKSKMEKSAPMNYPLVTTKEKELLLRELKKKALDGVFDSYEDWLKLGIGLKSSGFDVEDWQELSFDDDKTQKSCLDKWDTFNKRENGISIGTLFYYAPEAIPKSSSWFKRASQIAEENVYALYRNFIKLRYKGKVVVYDLLTGDMMSWEQSKRFFTGRIWEVYQPVMKNNQYKYVKANSFPLWFENPPHTYIDMITDAEKPIGQNVISGQFVWNNYKKPEFIEGAGTPNMFLEHLKENVCQGDEEHYTFLMKWIAHLIKYPNSKNGIAIAIKGQQGTGKTIIYKILSKFFDERFTATINSTEELTSRFNSKIASCYLLSLEEAVFAGTKRTGIWSKIKDLLTNEKITEERKGYEPKIIPNHIHMLITTNSDWSSPKERGDRRYFVLETNTKRKEDRGFFGEMLYQMETGGYKKLYNWVINDSGVKENEPWDIPNTKASETDIIYTASQTANLWRRLVEDFSNHEEYTSVIFNSTKIGGIYFISTNLSEIYKKEGISIDRARKETKQLFRAFYKSISIDRKSIRAFVFDNIQQIQQCLVDGAFSGIDVFASDDEMEVSEQEIAKTENCYLEKESV